MYTNIHIFIVWYSKYIHLQISKLEENHETIYANTSTILDR